MSVVTNCHVIICYLLKSIELLDLTTNVNFRHRHTEMKLMLKHLAFANCTFFLFEISCLF